MVLLFPLLHSISPSHPVVLIARVRPAGSLMIASGGLGASGGILRIGLLFVTVRSKKTFHSYG